MPTKTLFGLFIAAIFLILGTSDISAQTKGIGLAPALKELTISEDEPEVSFEIALSNTTDQPVNLFLSSLDFGALDDSGGIAFIGRSGQQSTDYGLRQWMNIEPSQLALAPGQSQKIKVTIKNDQTLRSGGHYGAVVVSSGENGNIANNLAVLPAASTLVLLKKTGGENLSLNLESIKANSSLINLPKSVELTFKNTGNTHIVPRGTITMRDPFGNIIARGVINESSGFVLPEVQRKYQVSFKLDKQPWLPGKYTLETAWRYDGNEEFTIITQNHWYLGRLVIYLILAVSTVIVLIMYIRYRRRPPTRY